ncbi:MAG: hypothetical protein DRO39_05590 [Thermoprotei archaeon]|nr:MAG: hypothetical protein DRO39_05590 [Thermoprotei archaeon]
MAHTPRSLADRYLNELDVQDGGTYIVMYTAHGKKPPKEFYRNLDRIVAYGLAERHAHGSVICRGRRAAEAVRRIAEHYSLTVRVFKVVEVT